MNLAGLNDWFMGLGAAYGVNPYIFGTIYVGAIPFFLASIAWLVRRSKAKQSTLLPTLCAGFCFISAYLYLAIAGRGIPLWVWLFLATLIVYGAWSTIRDVRRKTAAEEIGKNAKND
jgi:4-hydroxybenzoate polyprenyltransferase